MLFEKGFKSHALDKRMNAYNNGMIGFGKHQDFAGARSVLALFAATVACVILLSFPQFALAEENLEAASVDVQIGTIQDTQSQDDAPVAVMESSETLDDAGEVPADAVSATSGTIGEGDEEVDDGETESVQSVVTADVVADETNASNETSGPADTDETTGVAEAEGTDGSADVADVNAGESIDAAEIDDSSESIAVVEPVEADESAEVVDGLADSAESNSSKAGLIQDKAAFSGEASAKGLADNGVAYDAIHEEPESIDFSNNQEGNESGDASLATDDELAINQGSENKALVAPKGTALPANMSKAISADSEEPVAETSETSECHSKPAPSSDNAKAVKPVKETAGTSSNDLVNESGGSNDQPAQEADPVPLKKDVAAAADDKRAERESSHEKREGAPQNFGDQNLPAAHPAMTSRDESPAWNTAAPDHDGQAANCELADADAPQAPEHPAAPDPTNPASPADPAAPIAPISVSSSTGQAGGAQYVGAETLVVDTTLVKLRQSSAHARLDGNTHTLPQRCGQTRCRSPSAC